MGRSIRAYILGAGSMGSLLAHEIAKQFPNEIQTVLLFRSRARLDQFIHEKSELQIRRFGDNESKLSKSQHMAGYEPPLLKGGNPAWIENLVVSTKTYNTIQAFEPYIKNLNSKSNILILQNGMGMAECLRNRFWPNPKDAPTFFQAISTHGAFKSSPNVVQHAAIGTLKVSRIPPEGSFAKEEYTLNDLPPFLKLIIETRSLHSTYESYDKFILSQIEKLMANICINPMTTILDCSNGDLLFGNKIVPMLKKAISEAIFVIKAEYDGVLRHIPEANSFLDDERLLISVLNVCKLTAQNSSSMREDVRNLNQTEIDWLNGHIMALGRKHGISTPINKFLTYMVKNKLSIEKSLEINATDRILNH